MNEPLSRPKILTVDDKAEHLFALEKLLRKLEVEVVQATSGVEALGLSLEHDFCLAIVDVQMPEMDGYEFVELLRGNPSTASLPVIFLSAIHSDEYHHRKGYDAGAVDFLSKPFVPEILLSKARVFLDLYRQRIKLQELVNELNAKNKVLAQVTGELQEANTALSKRAKQLEASNQVGQQVASVLELDELLGAVVESIHSRFGYYFVGAWLPNEAKDRVALQAGIGRDGSQCLEPGWSIGLDAAQSIIACVAQSGVAYRVDDVRTDARYLALDALPATLSEVALPLRVGEEMVGVLDIQSDRLGRFDDEDQRVLQTLANQIAIAIENARLYEQAQREITERKRAEEALREYSERLEEMVEERTQELRDAQEALIRREKLAILGQLAGGVGHELRNPLGAISNATYFLNMVLEEPEPEVKETLEILEKEVKTSERIISSLLDFARAKPPSWRRVDIKEVVREALSRVAVPENVGVVSQLDGALPAILADPDQLVQVFGNIILNAVQAMPEGGRLVVKTSEVSEKLPKSEWVAISFTDTGVGIPEENLDKLFEPLFTTKAKGIGLGMAVTKTLVEGHGGSIKVRSEVGKGSTFTVRLPAGGREEK
jgi:signal transduction histidine kinase/DNA-binding response OmpR family regulator